MASRALSRVNCPLPPSPTESVRPRRHCMAAMVVRNSMSCIGSGTGTTSGRADRGPRRRGRGRRGSTSTPRPGTRRSRGCRTRGGRRPAGGVLGEDPVRVDDHDDDRGTVRPGRQPRVELGVGGVERVALAGARGRTAALHRCTCGSTAARSAMIAADRSSLSSSMTQTCIAGTGSASARWSRRSRPLRRGRARTRAT